MNASRTVPGRLASLWMDTATSPGYPALARDVSVDVAVIGAGITGVTAALLMKQAGATVALLEARSVCSGTTGYTTAKVTSLHQLVYSELSSKLGDDSARSYAEANQVGLEQVVRLVEDHEIDCDLRRKPNYTYEAGPQELDDVQREAEVAARLGLPARFVPRTELPYPVAGAVRIDDQAEIHPCRYVLALADLIPGAGSHVFERTRVLSVDQGEPCRVIANGHAVSAHHVVVATGMPILDRGLYFARESPVSSYCVAVRLRGRGPEGMYISAGEPTRSIRSHPVADGELVLIGGEGHKPGTGDPVASYARLVDWAQRHFDVESVEYRWSTHDYVSADGMPYVGRLWPFSDRVLTATGFRKWGLANGTAAAMMLRDRIEGSENPWAPSFDSTRIKPLAAGPGIVKEGLQDGWYLIAGRIGKRSTVHGLAPGEGRVVRDGHRQVAVSRDDHGELSAVSARCTHLGCIVSWNAAERTWDCPCHGSRFESRGAVLQGPATRPLEAVPPPGD